MLIKVEAEAFHVLAGVSLPQFGEEGCQRVEKSCMSYNWEMFSKTLEVRALGMIGDFRLCLQSRCIVGVWNCSTLGSVTLCSRHFPCVVSDTNPNLPLLNKRNSPRYPGSQYGVNIALTSGIRNPKIEASFPSSGGWRYRTSRH